MNEEDLPFYVYYLIDPRNNKIFYVGRGKGNRANRHMWDSLRFKENKKNEIINAIIAENLKVTILKIKENISFEESDTLERSEIKRIGRNNLTNLTDGGQGNLGNQTFKGRKHTDATKQIMALKKMGVNNPMAGNKWKRSDEGKTSFKEKTTGSNHPAFGKEVPIEKRKRISEKLKGIKLTDEQKEIRRKNTNKRWELIKKGEIPPPNTENQFKKLSERNGKIYSDYLNDYSIEDLINKYSLKKRTILNIIKKFKQ